MKRTASRRREKPSVGAFEETIMPRLSALAVLLLCCSLGRSGDWPQWLGPNRDATSPEKIAAWKETPKVVWREPIGEGHSSPIVAGGKVFVHARVANKNEEEVLALDADSG